MGQRSAETPRNEDLSCLSSPKYQFSFRACCASGRARHVAPLQATRGVLAFAGRARLGASVPLHLDQFDAAVFCTAVFGSVVADRIGRTEPLGGKPRACDVMRHEPSHHGLRALL